MAILEHYRILEDDDLLIFFSGSKGYHLGLPTFWGPAIPSCSTRRRGDFAERLAADAVVSIDPSVYDEVPHPNSRHPKTGLHKRKFALDELLHLSPEAIRRFAAKPEPFTLPAVAMTCTGRRAGFGCSSST